MISGVIYALLLCVESTYTCDVPPSPPGGRTYTYRSPDIAGCRAQAHEMSKADPDNQGRYYVDYNKWLECRQETREQSIERDNQGPLWHWHD